MTASDLAAAQQQRAALGPAGERIAAIAFDLATASRTVAPDEVYAAIAAHRTAVLAELQPELDQLRAELATARAQIAPCGNCGHTQAEHDQEHSDCAGSIVKRLDCRCRGYDAGSAPTTT